MISHCFIHGFELRVYLLPEWLPMSKCKEHILLCYLEGGEILFFPKVLVPSERKQSKSIPFSASIKHDVIRTSDHWQINKYFNFFKKVNIVHRPRRGGNVCQFILNTGFILKKETQSIVHIISIYVSWVKNQRLYHTSYEVNVWSKIFTPFGDRRFSKEPVMTQM